VSSRVRGAAGRPARRSARIAGETQPDRKLTIEILRSDFSEVLAGGIGERHGHFLVPQHDAEQTMDLDAFLARN